MLKNKRGIGLTCLSIPHVYVLLCICFLFVIVQDAPKESLYLVSFLRGCNESEGCVGISFGSLALVNLVISKDIFLIHSFLF